MRRFVLLLSLVMAPSALAQSTEPSTLSTPEAETGPHIPAQLVTARFTTLSSEIPAAIEAISVKEGERFTKGQDLVILDCAVQKAQLAEAKALVVSAERTRAALARLRELGSTGTVEVEKASAEAAVAKAKLVLAETVVSKCAIPAPYDGRAIARQAQPHQYVQAGQPVLDILDDGELEVEFIVPSQWIPQLAVGRAIDITVDETRKTYPGEIVRLGAKVDSVSHSARVIAAIKGTYPELLSGMTGRVRMVTR
jgi:RND family efflux transporter MFP subunit